MCGPSEASQVVRAKRRIVRRDAVSCRLLFELLDPSRIDVELTEEFQLDPEQSTSAIIVHHPEARYFNVD